MRYVLPAQPRYALTTKAATTMTTDPHAIETMLLEERRYPPSADFAERANARPGVYEEGFEAFWEREGRERLSWFEPFDRLYEWEPPYAKWFRGGRLNVCFN